MSFYLSTASSKIWCAVHHSIGQCVCESVALPLDLLLLGIQWWLGPYHSLDSLGWINYWFCLVMSRSLYECSSRWSSVKFKIFLLLYKMSSFISEENWHSKNCGSVGWQLMSKLQKHSLITDRDLIYTLLWRDNQFTGYLFNIAPAEHMLFWNWGTMQCLLFSIPHRTVPPFMLQYQA